MIDLREIHEMEREARCGAEVRVTSDFLAQLRLELQDGRAAAEAVAARQRDAA